MQTGSTRLEKDLERNMIFLIFIRILRKKADITGQYSYLENMGFTDRTIVAVFTQKKKQKEEMKVGQINVLPFVHLHFDKNIRNETKCNNTCCQSQRKRAKVNNLNWKLVEKAVAKQQMEQYSCSKGEF